MKRTYLNSIQRLAKQQALPMLALALLAAAPLLVLGDSSPANTEVPKYKRYSSEPKPVDITDNNYGFSRSAPDALEIGDTAADFSLARAGGGTVNLTNLRRHGPVAIIFYRGHW
jgi:hypothetical protein